MNSKKNQQSSSARVRVLAMSSLIAALFSAVPAFADTLTFSSQPAAPYLSGESISESGYNLLFIEGPVTADLGIVSSTGTVIDGDNVFSCDVVGCPSGASGNYLQILNDGAVQFTNASMVNGFTISGLNFAFVIPKPEGPGNYGQLVLTGITFQGQTMSTSFDFPGQDNNGEFMFGGAAIYGAFGAAAFTSLTISACIYDFDMVCSNSLASPANNQAQFAIDDVVLNAVPEPGSFLLAGLGLGALGMIRRRKSRPAASPVSL